MTNYHSLYRCAVLLAVTACLGCGGKGGDNLPTATVTGTVTYKNAPVTDGTISFRPVADDGNPAVSLINSQGEFELTTYESKDGAVPGFHLVSIVVNPKLDGAPSGPADVIPEVYNRPETTPLTLEVQAGIKNHFEIVLEDQPK